MTEVIVDSARAAELRSRLTDEMVDKGTIVSKDVEAAFRAVPRHLFAPGATLALIIHGVSRFPCGVGFGDLHLRF